MLLMRVYAAIAHEPEQVQARIFRRGKRLDQHRVLREFAIGDRLVDAREILIDDAPRAEIEVADFAVAHLPIGQSHIHAARRQARLRILRVKLIMERRAKDDPSVRA